MEKIKLFLQNEYLENSGTSYLVFISAIILGLIFKGLISKHLSRLLYRVIGRREKRVGQQKFDELLTKPIGFLIMLSILYFGVNQLTFPESWDLVSVDELGTRMFLTKGFSSNLYLFYISYSKKIDQHFLEFYYKKEPEESENKMDDQLVPF